LPTAINLALSSALEKSTTSLSPVAISDILAHSIYSLDNTLTEDLLRIFPDPATIAQFSADEIRAMVKDSESGEANSELIARCIRGSTILVSLIDPPGSNLWVASLGDSEAGDYSIFLHNINIHLTIVLGIRHPDGHWTSSRLSSYHNGENQAEKARIAAEHPGETDCIINDRVLGALAVTRGM